MHMCMTLKLLLLSTATVRVSYSSPCSPGMNICVYFKHLIRNQAVVEIFLQRMKIVKLVCCFNRFYWPSDLNLKIA